MSEELIREELRRSGFNLSRVANQLGVNYQKLKDEYSPRYTPIVRPTVEMPTDISTLGKPGLQKYVIAVKAHGDGLWPIKFFNAIQRAHGLYDAGTHEMCQQKRKDGWIVLYLIPRKYKVNRRPYFARRDYI